MGLFSKFLSKGQEPLSQTGVDGKPQDQKSVSRNKPQAGIPHKLAGEADSFVSDLKPYLPSDLVAGSIPHVAGVEDEAVWNAASQACSTEKVVYFYSVDEGRVWYLACPSASLASNPDSWCPLAAALPGQSEHWDKETVYIYEQEGTASALRWDPDTGRIQLYIGASRTILPKVQSMEANFVTINPEMTDVLPWKNRQLKSELLARSLTKTLLLTGLMLCFALIAFIAFQYISLNVTDRNLRDVKNETETASTELITKSYMAMQSNVTTHMARIQELLDELTDIDGTLVKYEVEGDSVTWEALVPPSYSSGIMSIKGQVQPGIEPDGRVRIKGSQ